MQRSMMLSILAVTVVAVAASVNTTDTVSRHYASWPVEAPSVELPVVPSLYRDVLEAPVAVCFAPGTPPDVVARFNDLMFPPQEGSLRYFPDGSWSGVGEPTTLRWSLVPDGLYIPGGVGEPGSNSQLFSRMDALFGGDRERWIRRIARSFERWAGLTGLQYERVTYSSYDWDDGAAWGSGGSSTRGDVRIGMHDIDTAYGILAYNYFPENGDMVLDSAEDWAEGPPIYLFLRNVIMHEHGHGIGLYHMCSDDSSQLMEPYLNVSIDGPQHDDIRGGQRHYGDPFEPNDAAIDATDLGLVELGSPLVAGDVPPPSVALGSTLSIDRDGAVDWFRFALAEPLVLAVTVTPVGRVYDNSPQGAGGSCTGGNPLDSSAMADLGFDLLQSDGSTVIATVDELPAGDAEELAGVYMPDVGDYYIQVYESDSPSESQLYSVTLSAQAVHTPLAAPWPHTAPKNRYISIDPNSSGFSVALEVAMAESGEFPDSTGVLGWVGEPDVTGLSRVVSSPYYSDAWPEVVHIGDCEIVPVATYLIRATADEVAFSDPLQIGTIPRPGVWYYGDTVGVGTGALPPTMGFTAPNQIVNVTDVSAYLLTAEGDATPSVHKTWVDLHGLGDGAPPNYVLNVSDLQRILFGLEGEQYSDSPDQLDPADCP
ncbi:MAG: matrixin family metalloprotease [Phycisphaerales bacterium]|nr:MAG: matrixin family metalloprotease [Phycisphaerales bacterium]